MKEQMSKQRKSNIELLRIVAMLMIIAHHFSVHGGFQYSTKNLNVNYLWIRFIAIGGKIGVNIFVLISGYFLINAAEFNLSKLVKLWLQIFSYSVLFYIILLLKGNYKFEIEEFYIQLLPITYRQWWFASTYFVMFLLHPYLNKMLLVLSKKQYKKFIIVLTIIWCIIPSIFLSDFESNDLLWFIYLYAVAGYIRLYINMDKVKKYIV